MGEGGAANRGGRAGALETEKGEAKGQTLGSASDHHDVIVIGGEGAGGEQAPFFVFHGIQGNAAPMS